MGTLGGCVLLASLLGGCGDTVTTNSDEGDTDTDTDTDGEPVANLFVAQTPDAWLAGPMDAPGPGDHGDEVETETLRPVLPASMSPAANLEERNGDLRYALTSNGLTVSEVTDGGLALRGRVGFGAEVFDVSTVDDRTALVWTHETPVAGAHSRLEPIDARTPGELLRGVALELPGTIQFSRRSGDDIVAVLVEDDRDGEAVTMVYAIDLSNPMAPTVRQSVELAGESGVESGLRTIVGRYDRIYVATDVSNGSMLDVIEVDEELGSLRLAERIWRQEDIVAIDDGPAHLRVLLHDEAGDLNRVVSLGPDLLPIDEYELESGPAPAWSAAEFSLQVLQGSELLEFVTGNPGASPTVSLTLPGAPSELLPLSLPDVLAVEHLSNPGGGSRIAVTVVNGLGNQVSNTVEIEGDWVTPGRPTSSWLASETFDRIVALPIERTWFQPEGQCPDTTTEHGVVLLGRADEVVSETAFIPTPEAIESVTVLRAGDEGEFTHLLVQTRTQNMLFDITDPRAPVEVSRLSSAVVADDVVAVGSAMARLRTDNYGHQILELTPADGLGEGDVVGRLELSDPSDPEWDPCASVSHWTESMVARRDHIFVSRYKVDAGSGEGLRSIAVIDASDPSAPRQASEIRLLSDWDGHGFDFEADRNSIAVVGDALVVATNESIAGGSLPESDARIYVYDIVDPGNPVLIESIRRMPAMAHGGLTLDGDLVTSWAAVAADDDPSRMHVFAEKLDISDPAAPIWFEPLSVPGVPLAADANGGMLVVDQRIEDASLSEAECLANAYDWDADDEECDASHRTLAKTGIEDDVATVLAETTLPGELRDMSFEISPTRIFAVLAPQGQQISVSAVGWSSERPEVVSSVTPPSDVTGPVQVFALDERAVLTWEGGYGVFDAESLYRGKYDVFDRLPTECHEVELVGPTQALCVAGHWGVETLAL